MLGAKGSAGSMRAATLIGIFFNTHAIMAMHPRRRAGSRGGELVARSPVTLLALRQAQLSSILMWTSPVNTSSPESSLVATWM